MKATLPIVSLLTPFVSPRWGVHAPTLAAKAITTLVRLTHHECDNTSCRLVSFIYGSGFPALWSHENLNDETHEWVKEEFADVPLRFFQHIRRCIGKGRLVSIEGYRELPEDYVAQPPQTDARFAFLAGSKNRCFLPESQVKTFEYFDGHRKDYHTLHVLAGYGHLDVFMGKNAARDVFPIIVDELQRPT